MTQCLRRDPPCNMHTCGLTFYSGGGVLKKWAGAVSLCGNERPPSMPTIFFERGDAAAAVGRHSPHNRCPPHHVTELHFFVSQQRQNRCYQKGGNLSQ